MKAEERHHLKQNEFATSVARLATAAQANRHRVIQVVAAVVVIAGLGFAITLWQNKKRDAAGADFAKAMSVAQSQIAPAPTETASRVDVPAGAPRGTKASCTSMRSIARVHTSSESAALELPK